MQKKSITQIKIAVIIIYITAFSFKATAQFTVGGQLLQRAEYRNGYGKLIEESQKAAFFIGQRARIHVQYDHENVKFYMSIQDIRTWGSTSQVKETDNFLSVHEAYAEIPFGENWKAKVGRQELNYDNVRFLGNLDWALQARAHDFALVKYEKDEMKFHFGAGYNQVKESLVNQPYTIPNQYKSAQIFRVENQWRNVKVSILFWNNGLAQLTHDTLGNVTNETVRYSQTLGIPTLQYTAGQFTLSGFYYVQFGRDVTNKKIKAYDLSAQATHKITFDEEKGSKFQIMLGFEILSGTSQQPSDNINHSYNPFYGTNHAHNGYMDFFYVGNRYLNTVGLQDYFVRLCYDRNNKFFISLNAHHFLAAADVYDGTEKLSNALGTEIDFTSGYILNDVVSLQLGYSQFFVNTTFKHVQGVSDPSSVQNWGYVALMLRPGMKNRFVGLLF
ncbi:MAG TPA: alginate export family protein [Cyclobacteriaceae bacterium]|nr:alginate export family protein [Cyclobacteriaceae bacterium]